MCLGAGRDPAELCLGLTALLQALLVPRRENSVQREVGGEERKDAYSNGCKPRWPEHGITFIERKSGVRCRQSAGSWLLGVVTNVSATVPPPCLPPLQ